MRTSNQSVKALLTLAAVSFFSFSCKKEVSNNNSNDQTTSRKLGIQSTTYYLSASSNSTDFQSLVDAAAANDIIILKTGSHYVTTPIRLMAGKNNITIRGESGAVVRKAPNSYNAAVFEITGNYNTIDLIELDGGNLPEAGIIIYGQHNTVSNSKVHNCGNASAVGAGILLHDTGNPVCCYNTVIGCSVYYNYMVGVSQHGHSNGTIRDNQIYQNGAEGLTIDVLSHNNYVYNNWIHQNNTSNFGVGGIGIDDSNGNLIDNNTIDYTQYKSGITFQNNIGGCDGTTVTNNRINYNAQYGITERWTQYSNTNTSSFSTDQFIGNSSGTTTIIH
ncbi:parallel beta-helix repeat (two copies) [Mucilaginibacter lappiensis]|uniref:Parallel beta-helix repeat protein n=1 Tax=Mucilaginibacter lappiensis TaxID=354630 RepID=A0ABR6PC07_9SPHI|nr:right-handed parallel beta-helix repeat-containing protein [Mucilaginibacter lappiensis]MBB6107297.1 parallel beta-helix repeat protein [Mucilaginibacter lappiensis]SIQ13216.1 parallel beta-helix repeat (two copies) [Mucilaginibacter lappiensis]